MAEEISPLENHGWWMEQLRKDAKANRPEALRLADALETRAITFRDKAEAAAELRRLHALNGELLEALKNYVDGCSLGVNAAEVARAAIAKAEEQK
jgi:hypothetical protein